MSAISDFMSGLPSYNVENFSRHSGTGNSVTSQTPSTYVSTKESPSEILIVNDKTNVLLRFLYRKWAKAARCKKHGSKNGSHNRLCCKKRREAYLRSDTYDSSSSV